nr:histidine kinase dimerization/phospho-acceptor domain-containing protein [Candidatus Cloacimonas sp.]
MRRSTAIRKRKQKPQSSKAGLVLPVESVAKAKSAFIANISHEIRTPMNAIMGFAQMLKNSGLNEQQNDYVDVILDSGKKLLLII